MCRARLAVEDYFRRTRVCNETAAESAAVTADCVTSEVAASERERARPSWGGRPRAQGGSNMERLEMVKYTQTDKMEEVNPHNRTFK